MVFWGKRKSKLVAVFDVSSASVGGALVKIQEGKKPEVLEMVRRRMPFQKRMDHDRYFSLMLRAFENVSEKVQGTKGKDVADEVVCFFSSPWYNADFQTVRLEKEKPFTATEKVLENLMNEHVLKFENEEEERGKDTLLGIPELVEKENMEVRLNGYEVEDYHRRRVKSAELDYYASVVPEKVLSSLRERILKRFNDREVGFRTFPFGAYVVTRDYFCGLDASFLFVQITGEMTDLLWVREGVMKKNASFPIGSNFLLRALAEDLDTSAEEARSLFDLYRHEKVDEQTKTKIQKTLMKCRKTWSGEMNENIRYFSRSGIAPQKMFFSVEEKMAPWFRVPLEKDLSFIKRQQKDDTDFDGQRASYVGVSFIKKNVKFPDGVPCDVFLGIEAMFLSHSQNIEGVQ